ncbi:hypothetical protein FRC06_009594 [Ceratobasidium sp. 370]|nr:hypothetical protein FRC06_009594 [Ceratobasidium sp. 370]
MASSSLQGLNLIQPDSPPSNLTDAQDLLSAPLFADFTSNDLDLWSSIHFASDEPLVGPADRALKAAEAEPRSDSLTRKEADHSSATPTPASAVAPTQQPQFDFTRFLAEFGLSTNADGIVPSVPGVAGLSQPNFTLPVVGAAPSAAPAPAPAPAPVPAAQNATPSPASASTAAPAAKRARTAKTPAPGSSADTAFPSPEPNITTPLTASEDKRRRNTAASARFRLKKKEREAALDARAHALEERVTSLERECEGLRRENGWLRGLVVGVTGGVVPAMSDAPIVAPPVSASGSAPPASAPASSGSAEKRKRDEGTT